MTTDVCCYCPCPATHRLYADIKGAWLRVGLCEHHYRRGTDLPCPDCEPAEAAS